MINARSKCRWAAVMFAAMLTMLAAGIAAPAQSYTLLDNFELYGPVQPLSGFVADPAGNLYGTSSGGGSYNSFRTVYELPAPSYDQAIELYSFKGGSDGQDPQGPLI